jgi:AraC-like DNA-binding protein
MKTIPLVRRVMLMPAVSYLSAEGIPIRRHLKRAGLSDPTEDNPETLIPLHQVCDFLWSVARHEGIDDLGFRMSGKQGVENLGLFGRLSRQALTIHESVVISRAIVSSFDSGLRIWLEHHGDQVRYCQQYVEDLQREQIIELVHVGLFNALSFAGYCSGADWDVDRVELASDPIDLSAYIPRLANVPVSFQQPFTSIWLSSSVMSAPLRPLDAAADKAVGEDERTSYLESGPASDPIGQLQQAMESVLDNPMLGLQFTASIIGMSARTLQRRLAEQETSFSRLLQDVRFRNAQRFLRVPEMPLKEIGKRLGYTDLPNFIRAFKRWTGVGPSEFRRLHYVGGQE